MSVKSIQLIMLNTVKVHICIEEPVERLCLILQDVRAEAVAVAATASAAADCRQTKHPCRSTHAHIYASLGWSLKDWVAI